MAASLSGFKAHVVMPKSSLPVKKEAVIDLGAQVSLCEDYEKVNQSLLDLRNTKSFNSFISIVSSRSSRQSFSRVRPSRTFHIPRESS